MKALMIIGLAITLAGALLLAWADLTAKRPTWDSQVTDWQRRRRLATPGFGLIALGATLQIVAVAAD